MRFEVSYGSGLTHEVSLAGSVVVLGRDPACDLVLNDTKCSRRHAVVEDTAEGLVIRDSGSANGVYVNERRVDRSFLRPGDIVRLGDVRLRVLAEIGETVIVALDEAPPPPPAPAHESLTHPPRLAREVPVHRSPGSAPSSRPRRHSARPLTVSLLSGLWVAFGPCASIAIVVTTARLDAGAVGWVLMIPLCLLLVSGGLAMALGLRALAPWARHLQIASAYLALLVCPFTPLAATTLLYMNRSDVKRAFEHQAMSGGAGQAETTFALSILGMALVGGVVMGIMAYLAWPLR